MRMCHLGSSAFVCPDRTAKALKEAATSSPTGNPAPTTPRLMMRSGSPRMVGLPCTGCSSVLQFSQAEVAGGAPLRCGVCSTYLRPGSTSHGAERATPTLADCPSCRTTLVVPEYGPTRIECCACHLQFDLLPLAPLAASCSHRSSQPPPPAWQQHQQHQQVERQGSCGHGQMHMQQRQQQPLAGGFSFTTTCSPLPCNTTLRVSYEVTSAATTPSKHDYLPPPAYQPSTSAVPPASCRVSPAGAASAGNAAEDAASSVPADCLCSITGELMVDPVFTAAGNTYERRAIETWLRTHDTDPLTNMALPHKLLVPNWGLRSRIDALPTA